MLTAEEIEQKISYEFDYLKGVMRTTRVHIAILKLGIDVGNIIFYASQNKCVVNYSDKKDKVTKEDFQIIKQGLAKEKDFENIVFVYND